MCTWVGYIGKKISAEICLEMLPKIERLWSGYYTGMVTQNDQKLHIAKTMGNIEIWRNKFNIAQLPGNMGLFHSRTNSGGGDEAAHPYFDNQQIVALVSQGSYGYFSNQTYEQASKYGNMLLDLGYKFVSAVPGNLNGRRPLLKNNSGPCLSEIVANLVAYYYKQTKNPLETIKFVASEIPEESVTGFIFADQPGKIFFANTTQSLMVGKSEHGIYLGTSSIAFPHDATNIEQINYNSVSEFSENSYNSVMLSEKYDLMEKFPETTTDIFIDWLKAHPGALISQAVDGALRPLCTNTKRIYPCAAVAYRIIEKLYAENKIRLTKFNPELSGIELIRFSK